MLCITCVTNNFALTEDDPVEFRIRTLQFIGDPETEMYRITSLFGEIASWLSSCSPWMHRRANPTQQPQTLAQTSQQKVAQQIIAAKKIQQQK